MLKKLKIKKIVMLKMLRIKFFKNKKNICTVPYWKKKNGGNTSSDDEGLIRGTMINEARWRSDESGFVMSNLN